jgi:hypothetical protein
MSQTHSICKLTFRSAKKYAALRAAWPPRYLDREPVVAFVMLGACAHSAREHARVQMLVCSHARTSESANASANASENASAMHLFDGLEAAGWNLEGLCSYTVEWDVH